jgi:hypothetical protein
VTYCVPEGTCNATTDDPGIGCPALSSTLPFIPDVVAPCPNIISETGRKSNIMNNLLNCCIIKFRIKVK